MLMLDRRMLLRAGSAAGGAAALAATTTVPAFAHAPQAGGKAQPSFYRLKLGTIEITVVSDGTVSFPAETLWGDRAEDARGLLTSTFQPSSPVGLELNIILVNTGDKLMLIDAGCGVDKFQNTNGRLLGHLASAGYAPGDIDMILFTHLHFDHLWGISDARNASLLFPSAEFVARETEVAFWSDPALPSKVSAMQQPAIAQTNLKLASPRLRQIKAGAEVVPGVSTFDTAGHTPGHMSVHITAKKYS
jgi:glyoxylase-like metal-dependent hydrolase (beta-lactamase superfamily II)